MGKHLVLIGGGHAHMVTLANLHDIIGRGHRVTVIQPSEHHYYSGMGPGMLSRIYRPEQIRFATRHVVEKQGGVFVLDKALRIDPEAKTVHLASGKSLGYDVLSCNAGSGVPWKKLPDDRKDIYTVKPIEQLMAAQQRIIARCADKPVTVGVVGGGAAALEVAGNVWRLLSDHSRREHTVQLFARSGMLERFPGKVRTAAQRSLARRGIRTFENSPVAAVEPGKIRLESGATHPADVVFLAAGVKPSPIFAASGLPMGPDGGLLTNRFLQSTGYPEIFGGGDCIYFKDRPLEKVGVYAVRENPVLFHNLLAALDGGDLMPFDPGGDYLLIFNMGDGTGIFYKKGLLLGGRLAFWAKDVIDRRFMRKFQAIE